MLPRLRSTSGELQAGDWRGRPHGWNVLADKALSSEALCHNQLRKSRVSGLNPCFPIRRSLAHFGGCATAFTPARLCPCGRHARSLGGRVKSGHLWTPQIRPV